MPSRAPASPDDIQMSTVFEALKRNARLLVLLTLAVGGMTFSVLSLMAPRYQSEAELAIVAKGASGAFSDPRSVAQGPDVIATRMDKEAINTHVRAMQSPELLGKIAADLKLKDRPEFNSALGPADTLDSILRLIGIGGPKSGENERDRVLAALRSKLEVYSAKESRFIGVRMTSIDPELAAEIANALAENYRASLAEQGVVEIDDLQSVLEAKIAKLTTEVAAAETEVDRYRGQIDGFRGGSQNTGLNEQQMSELTAELTRAKAARGEAEARARSAREMMNAGSADTLADVQKSPLIQNLVQQRVRIERQISELSTTLLPGHPRMRQLNADLAGLKRQIEAEIAKIVDGLEKEAKVAADREESIKQSLDAIKARVVTNAPEEAQLRQLEASAKAKRTELENLQAQLEANRKRLDMRAQPVEAQIISKAQPVSVPVFPKKFQLSALMAVATLMFATAWTITGALFQGARRGPDAAAQPKARTRTEPVLIPEPEPLLREMDENEILPELPSAEPESLIMSGDDIAGLARHIESKRPVQGGHRTLLTGENETIDPREEALALVKAIARDGGEVILIDWSPSASGIFRSTGLDTDSGLNDLIHGKASFAEIIQRIPGSSAHAIACGSAIDVESCVDPDHLNLVLDALDEAYEFIIVAGHHDEARKLFETIEGRFDAGIVVAAPDQSMPLLGDPPETFLGFEVAEIDIIRLVRNGQENASPISQRITRATQPKSAAMAGQV